MPENKLLNAAALGAAIDILGIAGSAHISLSTDKLKNQFMAELYGDSASR